MEGQVPRGKVKWFNDLKGYGFITSEADSKDFYVHHSEIKKVGYRTLKVGEEVEFDVDDGPEGMQATNVVLLD
jgi:CspA family cold shock protein